MNAKTYPVILFCYNRPRHTEQVLTALKRNTLAAQSHLIVFADGPKSNASDEQRKQIEDVLQIVQKDNWCGSVEYHFAETNLGCRNSIINGITEVLSQHEAAIILEDDIVTSPHFLTFMNQCLQFYKRQQSVFSISGVTLPSTKFELPDNYPYDVFFSLRQLNSGWGTWSDRWQQIDWNLDFVPGFLQDKTAMESFSRGGDDLIPMLKDQTEGRSDAWDIQFTYNHFIHHALSVIPRHSYIDNIGGDGSGTHHIDSNFSLHFDLNKAIQHPRLPEKIFEDKRIINAFYNVYCRKKRPVWQKMINRISRMLCSKKVFIIKKKIYN